ncbi:hypothetical protein RSOL_508550 [Rhizoctonia solani AG-3 Rhs1AP]|uniref:Uncharacterized protein n=2 Tax=Rhizoctonia solani AG-3 TaxID=1086053 RepID=A0A074S5C6_9AGAM|nr:hypothetical protein RSOL_508550 [Rhizoctonia solani AG-3 Rhs1AP]KEP52083.1 hypothetical protein V565_050910 [Rhizoctonia solani 123E]
MFVCSRGQLHDSVLLNFQYISSGSSHGSGRYHAGSAYGGSYSYPDRERYASITTLHRPPLPHSRSFTSLVGEPSITVIVSGPCCPTHNVLKRRLAPYSYQVS